jgi:hypothetical protein
LVTQEEYDGLRNDKKKKKKEEVQDINNASKKAAFEVNQEEEGEEDKKEKGEVTPLKDPLTEAKTSKKRKFSPKKPLVWKKSSANKPQS